ncbi:MAG TPA: putative selenium-dependent hydroxylase accessory protein YqeC [Spirochaetaceae bacterium]|nr:putative selenium-dependent hydroxylase accessory protein YqeC [Spirochaetaceae bacterium]
MPDMALSLEGSGLVLSPLFDFAYSLLNRHDIISIVGGGGKTSFMLFLKEVFNSHGQSVMMSTTTHLSSKVDYGVDATVLDSASFPIMKKNSSVLFVSYDPASDKYRSPGADRIKSYGESFDKVIIEADGSRGLPLKYHLDGEPVILEMSSAVVSIIGADSIGAEIKSSLHRHEAYECDYAVSPDKTIDASDIGNIIASRKGCFCGAADSMGRYVLINKMDVIEDKSDFDALIGLSKRTGSHLVSIRKNYVISPECTRAC